VGFLTEEPNLRDWLRARGIHRDLYDLGYDIIDSDTNSDDVEIAPVLRVNDGVLSDADVVEIVLKFG
jgi:hypothetical protein